MCVMSLAAGASGRLRLTLRLIAIIPRAAAGVGRSPGMFPMVKPARDDAE
jgi:hypothetical protein